MALTRFARFVRVGTGLLVVAGCVSLAPPPALAIPSPNARATDTVGSVTQKLAELAKQNEQLAERYNKSQIDVAALHRTAAADQAAAATAQAALAQARTELAASVSAQYKAASFSRTAALLASSSGQNYIETLQSLNMLAQHEAGVARVATEALRTANATDKAARAAVKAAIAQRANVASQRDALQGEISRYRTLLTTLTAAQRLAYFSVAKASPAQIAHAVNIPAPSKRADAAISAARAQLGKPYVYGASGPSSFDCSGLTAWAWAAAGVSLPHNAAAQYGVGTHVSQSQLQPGDLVFFYSPIGHVGIYIGGGLMIHAPTSGDVVKISSVMGIGDYVGATRLS